MPNSRGTCISAYNAAFARGAKCYGANIQSGVITSAHIADGTVVAADVKAGAITSAKLGAAAVTKAKMKCAQVTGLVVSAGVTYAVAHGLAAVPAIVVISPWSTAAILSAKATVGEAIASARTSANIYVTGAPKGVKFMAYVQI